jgi:hypothetical protein
MCIIMYSMKKINKYSYSYSYSNCLVWRSVDWIGSTQYLINSELNSHPHMDTLDNGHIVLTHPIPSSYVMYVSS